MDTDLLHYISGEEIHVGDRVQYDGNYATVVFVSNGEAEEFSAGYEQYSGAERGVMVCDDDGGEAFVEETDELLTFLDRG